MKVSHNRSLEKVHKAKEARAGARAFAHFWA